jgi:CheY-like chemotaxis protein
MPRILVVDDDPLTQSLMTNVLKKMGYETVSTEDGSSALDVLGDDSCFDVILSDIRMPKMDGFRFLDALATCYSNIPVIMSSVHTGADVVEEVMKRGSYFLPKPFMPDELVRLVNRVTV